MNGQSPEASRPAPDAARAGARRQGAALDPIDFLVVLAHNWRLLVVFPFLVAVATAVVSLLLPVIFTATTRILPPQQHQSTTAAMLSQLGGLAGAAGGALGLKNPSDLYVEMLQSETVADALIERFQLKQLYRTDLMVETRRALEGATRVSADKTGIIAISVDARDPKLAADLANAYAAELHRLTNTFALTEASQRRLFFERQLGQTKQKLADSEVRLRHAMEAGGLVSVDAQSRATVETVTRLRAEISAKEVQMGSMRAYATAENPDMRRAEQELVSMRRGLARLEGSTGAGAPGEAGDAKAAVGLGNIGLLREVKYNEVMFELLAKQFELARADEGREAPLVQVLDPASPPERRSKPKRTRMVLLAAAGAFLASVLAAFVWDAAKAVAADPVRRQKLAAVGAALRLRRGP